MSTDKKKSITSIFDDMDYEDKTNHDFVTDYDFFINELKTPLMGVRNELKTFAFCETIEKAIQAATENEDQWRAASYVFRTDFLLNIYFQGFLEESQEFIRNKLIKENEFSLGLDFFNYYSSLAKFTDGYTRFRGIVFLLLQDAPFYIVAAAVSAALAAGNSVILQTSDRISLCLSHIFFKCNIEKRWLTVVTKPVESKDLSEKIKKVIFFGSRSAAQDVYINSLSSAFSFLCPNNTSAVILESCDLSAAVEKIVSETWDPDSATMWAVSTAVVQESIYKTFLEKLKFRIKQLKMEKKNHSKFKDKIICEKIKIITTEAIQAGAVVEECSTQEDEWAPTVIVHYQNQHREADVPVLNVLVCRTAKEGVALLNNSRYCLGTSIWTEISSQALQIASMLVCKNIWVNCHGVIDPSVPLSPSGFSGDCVFGGQNGLLEFIFPPLRKSSAGNDQQDFPYDKFKVRDTVQNAHNAFNKWLLEKNKLKYFQDAGKSLNNENERRVWFDISFDAQLPDFCSEVLSPTNKTDFYVVQRKVPIGVIAIFVDTCGDDILSVILPVIVLGNTVVLVVKNRNEFLETLLERFNKFFPKNLFNVVVGSRALIYLALDPNVEALWICNEVFSPEIFKEIKSHSVKTLKHIWIMDKYMHNSLIHTNCVKSQIIWLSKVDQFP